MKARRLVASAIVAALAVPLAGCAGSSHEGDAAAGQARYDVETETETETAERAAADADVAPLEAPAISEYEVRGPFDYGWKMSCNDVFAYTPDDHRYYDGVAYNYDDCVGLMEVDMPQLIDALADSRDVAGDAQTVGRVAALDAVFEQLATVLCYGEDCVTRGDFGPY